MGARYFVKVLISFLVWSKYLLVFGVSNKQNVVLSSFEPEKITLESQYDVITVTQHQQSEYHIIMKVKLK